MLTVLLASSTAALYGVADFLGGLASRRHSALAVTATAHCVGLVIFAAWALVAPGGLTSQAMGAGAAAGVAGGVGVASLYAALSRGRMSLVAPLTAALSGSLPAVYDVAKGSHITPLSAAGLLLALAATVIVSATAGEGTGDEDIQGMPPSAIGLAVLAGVGFAGSFVFFSMSGATTGVWPLLSARVVSVSMLATLAAVRVGRPFVPRAGARLALGAGALDAAANVTMLASIRIGPLAVAAVLGSLYPVGTILLARYYLHERLRPLQRVGVGLALVAVVLSALSQSGV